MPSALEILISDYLSANNHLASYGYHNPDADKLVESAKAEQAGLLSACERSLHIVGAMSDGCSMIEHARRNYDPAGVCRHLQEAIAKVKRHHFTTIGTSTPENPDKCALCGHDIRDDIHLRYGEKA